MMRYRWSLLTALLAGASTLSAQDSFVSVTTYELSAPVGDTRRFIPAASWVGLSWEGRWTVARHVSTGVLLGLNEFSHRSNGTMNFPSGAATGEQLRYLLSTQVLATSYVYPFAGERHRWYVGGGVGATRVIQGFELGTRQIANSAWHVVVAPEVGAEVRSPGGAFVGVVGVRFNAPLATGDYLGGGARSFQHVTLRLGIGER